jgi:flagellar hook-basal body complex protein FliE
MPIDAISPVGAQSARQIIPNEMGAGLPIPGSEQTQDGKSFGEFLTDALGDVNALQQNAGLTVQKFATGAPMDVHQVMIAVEQASTALALTTQVRNKLVDAYTEVMHTQV